MDKAQPESKNLGQADSWQETEESDNLIPKNERESSAENARNKTPEIPAKKTNKADKTSKNPNAKNFLIIFISILAGIVIIVATCLIINSNPSPKPTTNENHNSKISYQNEIAQFLNNRYGETFNIEFIGEREAKPISSTDNVDDVVEYVYSFTSRDDDKITNYAIYALNEKTGAIRIYESHEKTNTAPPFSVPAPRSYDDRAYGDDRELLTIKREIVSKLESYLGSDYTVEPCAAEIERCVKVETDRSLEQEAKYNYADLEDVIEYVDKLVKDTKIENGFGTKTDNNFSVTITYKGSHREAPLDDFYDKLSFYTEDGLNGLRDLERYR